jgi:hypothetical protein
MKVFSKSILALTLLISVTEILVGCTPPEPTMFGVRQSQWQQLTPEQQTEVIKGYNERAQIDAQNAPIINAINAGSTVAQQAIWQSKLN